MSLGNLPTRFEGWSRRPALALIAALAALILVEQLFVRVNE